MSFTHDINTHTARVEPMCDKPAEDSLPELVEMLIKRIEVLEEKLNTFQGMDRLAVEVEERIARRIRNRIGINEHTS